MNSKLPAKKENSFFRRIKNFFRKIFFNEQLEKNEDQTKIKKNDNKKNQFQDSIKVESKNDYLSEIKKEEFLDELESNPKTLYDLPIEKLKKIENYYTYSIKINEEKLDKLKKAN